MSVSGSRFVDTRYYEILTISIIPVIFYRITYMNVKSSHLYIVITLFCSEEEARKNKREKYGKE